MPSRNIIKTFAPHSYYHVYNRGVAKQPIFIEAADKHHFIKILSRYLDPADQSKKVDGSTYRKFDKEIELLCYCLMNNHFHLLIYQSDSTGAITDFVRSVMTGYTMYFNRKYGRVGSLFQGVYKASHITNESYLLHISRYIHLNPRTYRTYYYSSISHYLGKPAPAWLHPQRVLDLFEGSDYLEFLEDYEDHNVALEEIKYELADY